MEPVNARDPVRIGLDRDLYEVMHGTVTAKDSQSLEELYLRCGTIAERLAKLVGPLGSTSVAQQIGMALTEATNLCSTPARQEAARILLGVPSEDAAGQLTPRKVQGRAADRLSDVVSLYRTLAKEHKVTRTNRQILQRQELPEIRGELVDALLALEQEFTNARRSDTHVRKQRHDERIARGSAQQKIIDWPECHRLVQEIASDLRTKLDTEDGLDSRRELDKHREPWDRWAVIAMGRGGMPIATHLSHLLGIHMVGFASVWQYVIKLPQTESGSTATPGAAGGKLVRRLVVDALYTPTQDHQGSPDKFIVVDDIVANGHRMERVIRELRARYDRPIDVYQASLLRDAAQVGGRGHRVFYGTEFNSKYWYVFPWEGGAPSSPAPS